MVVKLNRLQSISHNAVAFGIAMVAALTNVSAQAATQGSLGATSTGSITITASVPNRARITGLSDVTFASQDPNTAASNAQNVCVWSNTATKGYTVTASGSGAANAFTLSGGAGLTVPYSVQWSASSGSTTGTGLAAATASAGLVSTATHQTCNTGDTTTASLIVNIATADLGAMQATTSYAGSLSLLVTPQ